MFRNSNYKKTSGKNCALSLLLLIFVFAQTNFAQEKIDEQMIAKIKAEGFQHSQAMDTVGYVTDVFGPRLTNSPNLKNAQNWIKDKMISWGFQNVQIEPWGNWEKGWSVDKFSVEMLAPTYDRIIAYPYAWTPSTNGTVSGQLVIISIRSSADFDKYRGKLKGAIVMDGRIDFNKPESRTGAPVKRFTDEELERSADAINPTSRSETNYGAFKSYAEAEKHYRAELKNLKEINKFLHDEGVVALLEPSQYPNGVLRAQGYYETDPNKNIPGFIVSLEQYGRIMRLLDRNIPVKLELNLQTSLHDDTTGYNVVGEITGSDPKLKDEVVLLGGHFDSWQSGTGATDNAAGALAMVEALRILKAVGAKPRRTIRVALWSGEEQDWNGSRGYAQKYYGDPETMTLKPGSDKLDAYFNLDIGTGRIRGIFLQGNEAVRPIFEEYLKPFNYLGAKTVSILNTGGTDHAVFDGIGLPSFQFIQDPVDYFTRVHHSNLDVLEAVNEEDLKINAVIVAAFAYQTAMRDEKLPRKPFPKP